MHMIIDRSTKAAGFPACARASAVALLVAALLAGCGAGKQPESATDAGVPEPAQAEPVAKLPAAAPANEVDKESRMATAVTDGKTSAPVDMKYDLPSKPGVGVPFEVELAFDARMTADALEVEISEAPGLVVVSEKTIKFEPVEGGQSYTTKLLVKGDNPGLYYIGVVAKMSTSVQTESRAFAIPVVIGDPPAAEKPAPSKDAAGQAIESMPAAEPKQ
jgi:hypothetical protein